MYSKVEENYARELCCLDIVYDIIMIDHQTIFYKLFHKIETFKIVCSICKHVIFMEYKIMD